MGLPKLYLIGTPLGNVEDITLRARRMFGELTHLFAEDTRELMSLLNHLQISITGKKIHSFSSHNMKEAVDKAIRILQDGESVGLSTDRGMPAISDPGALLVKAAMENAFPVVPVPGPSSVTTLVSASGLTEPSFLFVGFLPTSPKARGELWASIRQGGYQTCFLESPQRLEATLAELAKEFPLGRVLLGREMTKQFEQFQWCDLSKGGVTSVPAMGEFSLLLVPGEAAQSSRLDEEIQLRLMSEKDWSKQLATRYGVAAAEIYNALHAAKRNQPSN